MDSSLTTKEVADRLGISRETLLSWERRYGFPRPHRQKNGARAYSLEIVNALAVVLAERAEGVPLHEALERAGQAVESAAAIDRRQMRLSPSLLVEVLDRLDSSVVIMSGHHHVIEFANSTHRRLYPGTNLVGQRALEVLSHSNQYFDLAAVLSHVMSSGETLRWASQVVPIFGEDRWASFSYGRLSMPGEPPRILLLSRDVTEHVLEIREAQALAGEATRVAAAAARQVELLELMIRVAERIAEGTDAFDLELLAALQRGLLADSVSAWVLADASWQRIAITGGGDKSLPGFERDRRIPAAHPDIDTAMKRFSVTRIPQVDFWNEEDVDGDSWCLIVPVAGTGGTAGRGTFLLVEGVGPHQDDHGERILHAIGMLLGKV